MITPLETTLLQSLGVSILTDLGAFAALSLCHGVFVLLFCISTVLLLRRGLRSSASMTMFTVTALTFALSTMYWASNFAVMAYITKYGLIDTSLPLQQRPKFVNVKAIPSSQVSLFTSSIIPVISDAVVIWRAWVLFPDQQWVMLFPLSVLLGTFGTTLTFISLRLSRNTIATVNSNLNGASLILSLCTNVITTLMIAYKLWSHRRFVVKKLGISTDYSPVQRVLITLVESGFIYSGLQAVVVALSSIPNAQLGTGKAYATQVFLCSYTVLAAMYPTVVIILVNTQRSMSQSYGFSDSPATGDSSEYPLDGSHPATAGHLSFAQNPSPASSFTAAASKSRRDKLSPIIGDSTATNSTFGNVEQRTH